MRFGKKGKLRPCYDGPYQLLRRIDRVAYELDFPSNLSSVHLVLHVSLLKMCIVDPTSIITLESLGIKESLSYEEVPVEILDWQIRKLRYKKVASVRCSGGIKWLRDLLGRVRPI
ncbi:hypothetical protein MTR67_047961 [Solanum verrucosum]|uniref:Tf2-1-like SH3-like domain-containing protein n=1 Tax=Solanum verrucosum TaxID=315347 RepID=A0AAF0V0C5_SOLVR|nr:hypothetical protein MTR67_047961 [Solanum verrucosum]